MPEWQTVTAELVGGPADGQLVTIVVGTQSLSIAEELDPDDPSEPSHAIYLIDEGSDPVTMTFDRWDDPGDLPE